MPAFVLIVRPRQDEARDAGYGITATKKLGGAVIRNRVKRRFRAVVREVFPVHALAGADHVLIGRSDALTVDYARLVADVAKALGKAKKRLVERAINPPRDGEVARSDGGGSRPSASVRDESPLRPLRGHLPASGEDL